MITVAPDGVPCKLCNKWHPTLFWHEKYNDYELNRREKWEEMKKSRPMLFGNAEYEDHLPLRGLKQAETEGACVQCGCSTFFQSLKTGNYVCCDMRRYMEDGLPTEA